MSGSSSTPVSPSRPQGKKQSNPPATSPPPPPVEAAKARTPPQVVDYTLPKNYQQQLVDLEQEDWFHGGLPFEDVEDLLKKPGDFLLRISPPSSSHTALPCISVRWEGVVLNFLVGIDESQDAARFYLEHGVPLAHSIVELARSAECGPILMNPIGIQRWELRPEDVVLKQKLGEGFFAVVYAGKLKAKGKRPEMDIACKVMKENSMTASSIDEMMKEARFMRDFSHEVSLSIKEAPSQNLVCFLGVVASKGPIQIVMELVQGGSLDVYLKKTKGVTVDDRLRMCLHVSEGLNYLHQQKTMHRDLAARNCLIVEDTQIVKVSDFGKSRRGDAYTIPPGEKTPVRWTAPEVLQTSVFTRAADVYAFAIVCWEIFTDAEKPYGDYKNEVIRDNVAKDDFRPKLPPNCPKKVCHLIKKCWQTKASERPQMDFVAKEFGKIELKPPKAPKTGGGKTKDVRKIQSTRFGKTGKGHKPRKKPTREDAEKKKSNKSNDDKRSSDASPK